MARKPKRLPSNWRKRIEVVHTVECFETLTWRFIRGQTPRGFFRHVGQIEYSLPSSYFNDFEGAWVEEVKLGKIFRGRKFGLLMYETLLNREGTINTNFHKASDEAQRVWQSLCRRYPYSCDFFTGTLTVSLRANHAKKKA